MSYNDPDYFTGKSFFPENDDDTLDRDFDEDNEDTRETEISPLDAPEPTHYFLVRLTPESTEVTFQVAPSEREEWNASIEILGRCRLANEYGWSIRLRWVDPAGMNVVRDLPARFFQLEYSPKSFLDLANYASPIEIDYSEAVYRLIREHLNELPVILEAQQPGWFYGNSYFVLPNECYGTTTKQSAFLRPDNYRQLFQQRGTLEGWKNCASLAAGNSRLVFALCAAFAGTLLHPLELEGGGFHFQGESSSGKTTALTLASSVWGNAVNSWRVTDTAMERIASNHNDTLLLLDELGEVSADSLDKISYMLGNGAGKSRGDGRGGVLPAPTWKTLFLSSGELDLTRKLASGNKEVQAGQKVRFIDISVEKDMLRDTHGAASRSAFIEQLNRLSNNNRGHAGRKFAKWLAEGSEAIFDKLRSQLDEKCRSLESDDDGGITKRVLRRFALVWVAGEAAQEADVLPRSLNVSEAIRDCVKSWRDTHVAPEKAAEERFFSKLNWVLEHDAAKFQLYDDKKNDIPRGMNGYRKLNEGETVYYFYVSVFKTLFREFDLKKVVDWLRERNMLVAPDSRNTKEVRIGKTKKYFYVVREIFESNDLVDDPMVDDFDDPFGCPF